MRILLQLFLFLIAILVSFALDPRDADDFISKKYQRQQQRDEESMRIKRRVNEDVKINGKYKNSSFGNSRQADWNPGKDLLKEFLNSLYVDRTFNSSFALNVPLFTVTIPGYGRGLKTKTALSALNVGNLAVLGIVVLGGLALVSPLIFPEFKRSMGRAFDNDDRQGFPGFLTNGLVGISESIMSFVEKSVDDLPSLPRLDAQECVKRSICEAHNQPKKYGLVGLLLQLFFPPYTETDEPSRIVSKYQLAARYGRQDNANCAAQYDGCMINFLDLIQGIINLIF
ncbi:uncharacterized protein B4U79_10666 [Dinothrombium tinctorium]|uniref:Uncharacterized protein n=1 Tax=Dinothrombium tinctorium TaxID=1965070 RepID=A0A3S3NZC1_9ACAR|nr:uncharacterized protein B4U79_01345 [Dinothrombium tinctorium]RWS01657.1 uncharacterized protein B4U79_10666 [Dinothrombium tinctorium]